MIDLTPEILALLFGAALLAGWVDTLAGGGGLITIPALLLSGIPPAAALATNKLQGSFGTLTAALFFLRRGLVSVRQNWLGLVATAAGAALGGLVVSRIDAARLAALLPFLLIAIGLYFLFFAGGRDEPRPPRMGQRPFDLGVAPALGFYDGFFGPGTGSFMTAAFLGLRGFAIRQATAHTKLFNFASNVSALAYFALFGQIAWTAGVVMIAGQMLGAWLGGRTVAGNGVRLIRPVTVIVCFGMSLRMLLA